jgi:hypothetical protein
MPKWLADPRACLAHIDSSGACRLTAERADMKARPGPQEPKVAPVGKDGTIKPMSELNRKHLRIALARHVHPDDVDRAVKRLVKADSLRPLRPASQACRGKSILEMLWEELDAIVERLMAGAASEEDKGRAQGVAYAIAVIENPYLPSVERIREEAMDRWEADQ